MKLKYILLFGAVVAFSSCSTAYRSAQTPDDVYYSPAPLQNGYVKADKNDQGRDSYYYQDEEESQIRKGIENPVYRTPVTTSIGYGYGYDPYGYNPYGYNPYGFNSFYNPYYYGGYSSLSYLGMGYGSFGYGFGSYYSPYTSPFYNPHYGSSYGYSYYPGKITTTTNSGPRRYNLNPYINGNTGKSYVPGNTNVSPTTSSAPVRRTTGVGNAIRRVVSPNRERNTYVTPNNNSNNQTRNNNNNNNYNQRPERTFNNSPQVNTSPAVRTPSSTPSSSGSSAPVRSFGR
jgi:hypothetical protein